jgi:hypothetical protein
MPPATKRPAHAGRRTPGSGRRSHGPYSQCRRHANLGATAHTIHPTLDRDRTADTRPVHNLVGLSRQIVCPGRERIGQRAIQPTRAPLFVEIKRHHLGKMEARADNGLDKGFARWRAAGHVDDRQASTAEKVTAQVGFQSHSTCWTASRSRDATPGGATAYCHYCLGVWGKTADPRRRGQWLPVVARPEP